MTKIEIESTISKYLATSPIIVTDLLNHRRKISSYDAYISIFTMVKSEFRQDIVEFFSEAEIQLQKMKNFMEKCERNETVLTNIEHSMREHFMVGYYSSITFSVKLVFPDMLNALPEHSTLALKLIYKELGYGQLTNYLGLLNSPSSLSSYLNDSNRQNVAMHYILFATNHHSSTKLNRNLSVQSLHQMAKETIDETVQNITEAKDDYIHFMDQEKESYNTWFIDMSQKSDELYATTEKRYKGLLEERTKAFDALEKTYSDKLKVEEPAAFMKKKAEEYKVKAIRWASVTVVLALVLICLICLIINPDIQISDTLVTINFFSGELPIYNSIIIFSVIALVIYVLKLFVKMTVSSKHLSEEYHQKYVLTYFYLSLIKNNSMSQEQANMILATLFTHADTGLIKNDNSSEMESLSKLILSTKA